MMNPIQAVGSVIMNAFNFGGRAPRSEYWWFYFAALFTFIGTLLYDGQKIANAEAANQDVFPMATVLLFLVLIIPSWSVQIRRLHDAGFSGWWLLLCIVPFGNFALIAIASMPSEKRPNKWGPPYGHARLPGADIFNDQPLEEVPDIFKPGNIYGPDKNAPIQSAAEINAARKAEVSAYYKARVLNQGTA